MSEVIVNVFHIFQTYAQTYCSVKNVKFPLLLVGEIAENRAPRVDGEGAVVEEVCGAFHQLQTVEEALTGLLTFKVYGQHRTVCASELGFGEAVERIVLQSEIVHLLH